MCIPKHLVCLQGKFQYISERKSLSYSVYKKKLQYIKIKINKTSSKSKFLYLIRAGATVCVAP